MLLILCDNGYDIWVYVKLVIRLAVSCCWFWCQCAKCYLGWNKLRDILLCEYYSCMEKWKSWKLKQRNKTQLAVELGSVMFSLSWVRLVKVLAQFLISCHCSIPFDSLSQFLHACTNLMLFWLNEKESGVDYAWFQIHIQEFC